MLALYLKGLAMGLADLVPGVSGGTIALIVGIYEELLSSIGSLTSQAFVSALKARDLLRAFRVANGGFILAIVAGIATAILTFARPLRWLLLHAPNQVDAVFFGLILASSLLVWRRVQRRGAAVIVSLLLGAVFAFVLVGSSPTTTPNGALFLALSGAIAICALVLPGISGSFILVLLGKYEVALTGVTNLDIAVLAPLAFGMVVGLLSFVRFLRWLLRRFHAVTMATLTGFMVGSLRKVWPFDAYSAPSGATAGADDLLAAVALIALVALGVLAVLALDRAGRSIDPGTSSDGTSAPH